MPLQLTSEQWDSVLEASKRGDFGLPTEGFADESADADPLGSTVFLLALEGRDAPDPSWTFFQTLLDNIVQIAQPAPSITHIEMIVPSSADLQQSQHFSTYIFEKAQWWDAHAGGRSFYLGSNAGHWRAIPISCKSAARRVRIEANKHVGTAYSLARYVCAVPPVRAIASLIPDGVQSAAHCATLTARVLRRALKEATPVHASAWYGPATLFLEMSSGSVRERTASHLSDTSAMQSVAEEEEAATAMHTLLNENDDAVRELTDAACRSAIRTLARRACEEGLDETGRRIVQKQLATALLRWSHVVPR